MTIEVLTEHKKRHLDLLLLADEQESMIDRYLEEGDMFALYDDDLRTVCVVLDIDDLVCELKNIATWPQYQGQGYGKAMIDHISAHYRGRYQHMLVGTGDVPGILSFYAKCGFQPSHRIENFFTDNYEHPMFENGIQLVDMVYLKKPL